jgi:hypothetical protein
MIKSKERVQQHGEVFTPDSIVNDMLDLVDERLDKEEVWKYIDTTYLEPACGTGNFLLRILDRKLEVAQRSLTRDQWELALIHSLCSIYAIDIQSDNVIESKNRMKELIYNGTVKILELPDKEETPFHFEKYDRTDELDRVINKILDSNMQTGNFLTGKQYVNGIETQNYIVITEYIWSDDNVERKEVLLNNCTESAGIMNNMVEREYSSINYKQLGLEGSEEEISVEDEYDF